MSETQNQHSGGTDIDSNVFQHREVRGACDCPIHTANPEPFTAPLGLRFHDHVHIEEIKKSTAEGIYQAHHSYMDYVPEVNLSHHGIYYQDQLVGAITYRYPLISKKKLRYGSDGGLIPEEMSIDQLPPELQSRARSIIPRVSEDIEKTEIISGDEIIEAARICIGVDMPNLASAALARSQDRFIEKYGNRDIQVLLTWVRGDFSGSMVRALRDKGWTCTGFSTPNQASNRESKPIRERIKWRFLCPVEKISSQSTLSKWG